ncbi:MAG: glycosyltransferase [Pyrinomonadaceae bacterium]|nr:glycosyltransferase [Pyrinomonadaceae bacterium]
MNTAPRVALFADTFHETNGAANFLRRLVNFAKEKNYEFLCVRSGEETGFYQDGSVSFLDLKRGRASIPLDGALKFDPFLWQHKNLVGRTLNNFAPQIIHVTGLNDISQFGYYFAHFKKIPAVATWHTNAHEYAAQRLLSLFPFVSGTAKEKIGKSIEKFTFKGLMKLYFLAQMQLAPNEELVADIKRLTRRPSFLLGRGVDTDFLSPIKRRRADGEKFIIGFVGRLRPEKNVRFLKEIETALREANIEDYQFLIVGEGGERKWLENNLLHAELIGEIFGEELARTYAKMDLFVFPSQTDAFGNVVLEAMSSGVPSVVMKKGGPKFLIEHGINGLVAVCEKDFIETVVRLAGDRQQISALGAAARRSAEEHSWERVFEKMFDYYKMGAGFRKNIRA